MKKILVIAVLAIVSISAFAAESVLALPKEKSFTKTVEISKMKPKTFESSKLKPKTFDSAKIKPKTFESSKIKRF